MVVGGGGSGGCGSFGIDSVKQKFQPGHPSVTLHHHLLLSWSALDWILSLFFTHAYVLVKITTLRHYAFRLMKLQNHREIMVSGGISDMANCRWVSGVRKLTRFVQEGKISFLRKLWE